MGRAARGRRPQSRGLLAGASGDLARPERVSDLLEYWGGEPAGRYAALFKPGNEFALQFGSEDPGTWRPALEVLLESGEEHGLAAARSHGYRLVEIADHLGVHESTISRRLRKKGA